MSLQMWLESMSCCFLPALFSFPLSEGTQTRWGPRPRRQEGRMRNKSLCFKTQTHLLAQLYLAHSDCCRALSSFNWSSFQSHGSCLLAYNPWSETLALSSLSCVEASLMSPTDPLRIGYDPHLMDPQIATASPLPWLLW
jgi:hypothetical protein